MLSVTQGLFTVPLGDLNLEGMSEIPSSVFENSDVHLRIWFGNGEETFVQLSPDQRLTSVPYAVMAGNVEDGSVTAEKLAAGAVTADKLDEETKTAPRNTEWKYCDVGEF